MACNINIITDILSVHLCRRLYSRTLLAAIKRTSSLWHIESMSRAAAADASIIKWCIIVQNACSVLVMCVCVCVRVLIVIGALLNLMMMTPPPPPTHMRPCTCAEQIVNSQVVRDRKQLHLHFAWQWWRWQWRGARGRGGAVKYIIIDRMCNCACAHKHSRAWGKHYRKMRTHTDSTEEI